METQHPLTVRLQDVLEANPELRFFITQESEDSTSVFVGLVPSERTRGLTLTKLLENRKDYLESGEVTEDTDPDLFETNFRANIAKLK